MLTPRNSASIKVFLTRVWEELLEVRPIAAHQNFFDLGGHSFLAMKLSERLEKAFGVKLPLSALFRAPTIEQLGAILAQHPALADFHITPIQAHGSRPPFFCVDAFALFRPLALAMGPDQPFLGLPGVDPRRSGASLKIEDIAAIHVRRIRIMQPEGPYHLGGWCVHGIIAYEIARQLRAEGQAVALLALFDSPNPAAYAELSSWDRLRARAHIAVQKGRFHLEKWMPLRPAEKLAYLRDRLETLGDETSQSVWRILYRLHSRTAGPIRGPLLNIAKIEIAAAQTYRPQPYSGPVLLFRPRNRPEVTYADGVNGWTRVAIGGVRVVDAPGTHAGMFHEDNIATMAAELRRHLSPETGGPENEAIHAPSMSAT